MVTLTETAPPPAQLVLVPAAPPAVADSREALDKLPPDDAIPGPAPAKELVDSLRRWGMLEPLVFRAAGGGIDWRDPRTLISGRRRLKAWRALHQEAREEVRRLSALVPPETLLNDETVPGYRAAYDRLKDTATAPVRLVSDPEGSVDDPSGPVLTLLANGVRRDNPVTDLAMIERLLARPAALEVGERKALTEIARATGLAVATLKQRLKLRRLTPSLRLAFDKGLLSYTVALEAAKLPAVAQDRLVEALGKDKRPGLDDVREARRATVQEAQQGALEGIFEAPAQPPSAEALQARSERLIEVLRGTNLPLCQEAASLIADLAADAQEAHDRVWALEGEREKTDGA